MKTAQQTYKDPWKLIIAVTILLILHFVFAHKANSQQIIFEGDTFPNTDEQICKKLGHVSLRVFYLRDIIYTRKYPIDSCKCELIDRYHEGMISFYETLYINPNCRHIKKTCARCGKKYTAKADTLYKRHYLYE